MKKILVSFFLLIFAFSLVAQNEEQTEKEVPTGWKFGGALPALSYNTDVGFRYGLIGYVFDWGDGSLYPDYLRSLYMEASNTTKGSAILRMQYDDKAFLGSNVRFTGEIGYYGEKALDFYGFNGYEAIVHPEWMTTGDPDYKSRMFYRVDRKNFRVLSDFQFKLNGNKLRAYAGMAYYNITIDTVNVPKLNSGKTDDLLPYNADVPGLYQKYVQWGIIPSSIANGGQVMQLRSGIIYDTRDNEPMPNKGMWDEAILIGGYMFGHPEYSYLQFIATHRQYFTIVKKRLIFAYRVAYSQELAGNTPYFMLPFYYTTKEMQDGFGGAKTLRGIMRDRIVAKGVAMSNLEMRWRAVNTKLFGQDFYVAFSAFLDGAIITKRYEYTADLSAEADPLAVAQLYFDTNADDIKAPHISYGGGIRFGLNENFIVAVDYGMANNPQDGTSGLYIGLNWLF